MAVERWRQQANNRKKEMAQAVNKWLLTFLINKEKEALYFILQPPVAEEDDFSSSSCNILLYFGLGLMCVGSVIAFVGEDQTLLLERDGSRPFSDQSFYWRTVQELGGCFRKLISGGRQSFPIFILISGVGDKGYQTLELRLVGPILAVSGALLVCCRVIMCFIVII